LGRNLEPGFRAGEGEVAGVEAAPEVEDGAFREQLVTVRSTSGLAVDLAIRRPRDGADAVRRPLAILLGGHETGRDAIRLVADTRGVAVAALSWPYRGPRKPKGLSFLAAIPAIQDGLRDTPPAVLLALDWLAEQPWVAPDRIELVGASLGAPFVCIAGALDPRASRVWSLHGAATPGELLEHSLRNRIGWGPLRAVVASIAGRLAYADQLAPERWVARIAPRPFVMVNAEADERLPRELVLRLYESAREPKELVWLPGRHVEPKRADVVAGLLRVVLDRMGGEDDG